MFPRIRSLMASGAALCFLVLILSHVCVAQDPSEVLVPNPSPTPLTLRDCSGTIPRYTICEVVVQQAVVTPTPYYPSTQAGEIAAYTLPDVKADFHLQGTSITKSVHGFYDIKDGKIVFKIRFNASEIGTWTYTPSCALQANGGNCSNQIITTPGSFTVRVSKENGFLRRDPSRTDRFVYDSNLHPFIWGQTYYNILANVLDQQKGGTWRDAIKKSAQSYSLNKVRLLVYPFEASEGGGIFFADTQPFLAETDHHRINLLHWRGLDAVVHTLYNTKDKPPDGNRILAELILFTDSNERSFGDDDVEDDRYVKYIVARYAAFPNVMWCLSNEWRASKPFKDKQYWNDRAATVMENDQWMYYGDFPNQAPNLRQRALSIHPENVREFEYFNEIANTNPPSIQPWPSHAVLQFSINHGTCAGGSACSRSDEWASFSILNNRGRNMPVVNDEYGYLNTYRNGCYISQDEQRRAMWAIALSGGYGTFGDNSGKSHSSGSCPGTGNDPPPAILARWRLVNEKDPAPYKDIKNMFDFFNTNFKESWWKMVPSPTGRVTLESAGSLRLYPLELTDVPNQFGQYLVYAIPNAAGANKNFFINNLPAGDYIAKFYKVREGRFITMRFAFSGTSAKIVLPSLDEWVVWVVRKKTMTAPNDVEWLEDSADVPGATKAAGVPNAIFGGDYESWSWLETTLDPDVSPAPWAGNSAHQSAAVGGFHQHYFYNVPNPLTVSTGDRLVTYVYLDSLNPPREVMLQWNDGTWEHRAYWGENLLQYGTDGTASRMFMGPLPEVDQWVRLEVPAALVDLEGHTVNGMSFTLYDGRAVWDHAGLLPANPTLPTMTPPTPPATDVVWVEDSVPAGAVPGGSYEDWVWASTDPQAVSGYYSHQSSILPGMHQHFFIGATNTLTVNPGDKLFTYVYLDPVNPPNEIMLQWDDGSGTWDHRAYWGLNQIAWGADETIARRYMGPLPALGRWVRLEVPAAAVGLEGSTLKSMAFTLYNGTAVWDRAGKSPASLAVGKSVTQSSTWSGLSAQFAVDGNTAGIVSHTNLETQPWWQLDLGATYQLSRINVWNRADCCAERLSNFYVFVSDQPFTSTNLSTTLGQPGVSAYYIAGQAGTPSAFQPGRTGRYLRVQLTGTNYLSLAEFEVFGNQVTAPPPTLAISDVSVVEGNAGSVYAVFAVNLSASSASTVLVNYATSNGTAAAPSDYASATGTLTFSPGQTSKTINIPVAGDTIVEGDETFFVNLSGTSGATIADGQGQGTIVNDDAATPPTQTPGEVLWVEDALPPGAVQGGDEPWNWWGSAPPFSGSYAHQSGYATGVHQHYFTGATVALTPGAGDKLFAYVYLDPMNPPTEIMLQWNDGTWWEHRAYWGDNQIGFGTDGSVSRRYMGPLPAPGRWVRLEVPASSVGLEGVTVTGMAFTLYGGLAAWDYAGKVSSETIWVEDTLPSGATPQSQPEGWNWVWGDYPAPFSGNAAHQSALLSGMHQHYFNSASSTLTINAGNKVFAYIYLDPTNPPSEVMLQWDDGSGLWEHRAYWGANLIDFGVNGTASRYYMGPLPLAGRWVRLEVPASVVNLQGVTLRGMAFTLHGGRATWDRAGKSP